MKTKKEQLQELLISMADKDGYVNVTCLKLPNIYVDFSGLEAKKISNENQKAEYIYNSFQQANEICNSSQKADHISNPYQKAEVIYNSCQKAREIYNNSIQLN